MIIDLAVVKHYIKLTIRPCIPTFQYAIIALFVYNCVFDKNGWEYAIKYFNSANIVISLDR
jgi:hypothetical protein